MVALLLLGIIPGTNIQINFTTWLFAVTALVALSLLFLAQRKQLPITVVICLVILQAVRTRRAAPQA